jgi:hypothetical protein
VDFPTSIITGANYPNQSPHTYLHLYLYLFTCTDDP